MAPDMEVLWFFVIALLLVTYLIRDGADLGSGTIYLFVCRNEADRRSVRLATGPVWNGNEVWLLLAAVALYYAFPSAFASSGLRISAATVFGLLILRGIACGRTRMDFVYGFAGVLLAFALGTAIGFVIPGVPQWFPYLCGACSLAVLTLHSAVWMALHSTGELQSRCRQLASGVWWAVLPTYAALALSALTIQPQVLDELTAHSTSGATLSVFAVVALAGLIGTRLCLSVGFDLGAFASASCLIAGVLASVAASQVPHLLSHDLPASSAGISAIWWLPAFLVAAGYNITMRRLVRQKLATN
jgi:cytochrome d ubiquinol oxidase subunit II